MANIQLWTCHEDTGVLSNSYGNQKWSYKDGELRNEGSGLCLAPRGKRDEEGTDGSGHKIEISVNDMTNVTAQTCSGQDDQEFDFVIEKMPTGVSTHVKAKFSILRDGILTTSQEGQVAVIPLLAAGMVGFIACAALVGLRTRQSSVEEAEILLA